MQFGGGSAVQSDKKPGLSHVKGWRGLQLLKRHAYPMISQMSGGIFWKRYLVLVFEKTLDPLPNLRRATIIGTGKRFVDLTSSVGSFDLLYNAVRSCNRDESAYQNQEPMEPIHNLTQDGVSPVMLVIKDPKVAWKYQRQRPDCQVLESIDNFWTGIF